MGQERAFHSAIADDPGDDLHRLAWADWLDDHGDTRRADFIRAQLRLAALPPDDPARDALEDEADDLLEGHDEQWAGRAGELALEWSWHRGCVERVTVWADTLLAHGEELFRAAPIRELRLLAEAADMPHLAGCPLLSRVETLDLGLTSDGSHVRGVFHRDRPLQQLFVSPHLRRLRRVRLRGHGVEGPLVQTLIDTKLFARLDELDLSLNAPLGDRTARLLAAERSNTLTALDLRATNVTAFGLRQVMQARSWPALRRLGVVARLLFPQGLTAEAFAREWAETPVGAHLATFQLVDLSLDAASLNVLLGWDGLSRLEELRLNSCRLNAAGAEALAASEGVGNLRTLDLANNRLQDAGSRALAGCPHLRRLASLRLDGNEVGGPGIRAVAASPNLPELRELFLSNNYVGTTGAEALAAGALTRLRDLWLSDANLDADAVRLLAGSPALGRLRVLSLANNPLEDKGIAALARSPHLRRLRALYLDSCGMGSAGARALCDSERLNHLRWLGLRNTFISSREGEQLRVRFGSGAQF